ncbi:hypothetical protein UZ36_00070 [Candidatus Nitromaritima sp. SCGC AAA799-C22]|nr:hypothetical protein UZ36_00070 [Candidatus Nitromaritima sp. SCGC AAA799-C22]
MLNDLDHNKKVWNHELSISTQVYEPFLEVIADLIAKENYEKVVDSGCGTGSEGKFLRQHFGPDKLELFAVDITEMALKKSEPFYNHLTSERGLHFAGR